MSRTTNDWFHHRALSHGENDRLVLAGDGQAKDSNGIELEKEHAETKDVLSRFKNAREGIKIKVCLT